ncbi:MAG: hypothetical protein JXR07_03940 [Reichenbachiella sp.]
MSYKSTKYFISILFYCLFSFSANAQDINVILKRHFQAIGQSSFESIRSVSLEVTEVDGFGKGRKYELIKKRPNKLSQRGVANGNEFVITFNGRNALTWQPNQDSSFRKLNQREENLLHIQSTIGSPLVLGQKKDFYLEIHRSAYVDRRSAYVFRLDFPDGLFVEFFVDKKDFLIKKLITYTDNTAEEVDVEINYSNFKKLGSFVFPYKMERIHGTDPVIDIIVGEIAVGVGAANELFEAPSSMK